MEMEIRRSRFLTRLRRITAEQDARNIIEERRKVHFDAAHHCSAFVLGPDARTMRSSDDGEPAGTAGAPMLGVLTSNALTDVVAVVTRYFGGIKLGAGGLVRAYSDAVAQAVDAAGRRTVRLATQLAIDTPLAEAGALEGQLRNLVLPSGTPVVVEDVEWGTSARILVAVPSDQRAEFDQALTSLTSGALVAEATGQRWTDQLP